MLTTYGDSIAENQQDFLVDVLGQFPQNKLIQTDNSHGLTVRMRALHNFIQRLLRPIWDSNITYRVHFDMIHKQISNYETFAPVRDRLQNFLDLIEKNFEELVKQTTEENMFKVKRLAYLP